MKPITFASFARGGPALTAACALFLGGVAHAQPTISSIYPDGTFQFQSTNKLSFTVESAAAGGIPTANIVVTLYTTNLSMQQVSVQVLTNNGGLTITGTAASRVVTTPLTINLVYGAVIDATDANGELLQTNIFDTVVPSYTWEAEDFDYEGGKFFDNPQTNAYAALQGTVGVDGYNPNQGGQAYRPVGQTAGTTDGDWGNEACSDIPRVQYMDPNNAQSDYDIGWSNGGSLEWANYTRHYPTGKWNIYLRGSAWATATENADMFLGGTNGTLLGRFAVPITQYGYPNYGNQYQNFAWAPLIDVAGNLIEFDSTGGVQTLTFQVAQGTFNANFFMLMPVDPNVKPVPFVSNVSPNGTKGMFTPTNVFSFTANSVPGISSNNVVVTVNGITPYGLKFTGSSRVLSGSFPLATPNVAYSVVIKLTDANGSSTYNTAFSTFAANNYTWECEDWDYQDTAGASGKFFDNPQVDAYAGLSGVDLVDAHNASGGNANYRPNSGGLGNEPNGDIPRTQFAGTNDYDIGWTAAGQWANYTRTYPKGVYNVQFRAAGNAGGNDCASLMLVTSGVGTDTQTTTRIGQFNVPNTGSWQTYAWTPLVDSSGTPLTITNTGSVMTYQLHEDSGGWNGNFLMLVPLDTNRPAISHLYPDGSVLFQRTNTLSFVATAPLPINTNLITVMLNGTAPNLTFSGSPTNLTVTVSNLQPDTSYTTLVVVNTTNNDPAVMSYTFDTFSATNYTFETEDYDYSGGRFYDNPQVDAYAGVSGTLDVDAHNSSAGGGAYRPNGASAGTGDLGNEVTGDTHRTQYLAGGGTNDYDIGWTAAGQWANYTRTYPKGAFNVILRAASPSGQTDAASLMRVTGGVGTPNQTTNLLGQFNVPNTGGYQTYTYVPLVDTNGNSVVVTNSGQVATLRLSQDNGGWNANFLMFIPPVATGPKLTLGRTGPTSLTLSWAPTGGTLYSSPALGQAANWQPVANATNPMPIQSTNKAAFYQVR